MQAARPPSVRTTTQSSFGSSPTALVISEIGLGVSIPTLPGVLVGPGFNGLADQPRLNVLQFHNRSGDAIDSAGLTVEILNPSGKIISLAIPSNHEIPPRGVLMLYEQSIAVGSALVAIVTGAFLDAEGALQSQFRFPGAVPWELGPDVSAKLAVNLVLYAGTPSETGIDTFAANSSPARLRALTSPRQVLCRRHAGLVLPVGFDVLHDDRSSAPNVFSRGMAGQRDW